MVCLAQGNRLRVLTHIFWVPHVSLVLPGSATNSEFIQLIVIHLYTIYNAVFSSFFLGANAISLLSSHMPRQLVNVSCAVA